MKLKAFIFFFLLFPTSAFAAEQITSFTSDIQLHQDGTFTVAETIVYDFDEEERHGIFRSINKTHPQKASAFWKERYIDLELLDVSFDGIPALYEVADSHGQLEVKIGDPDTTISGEHTYKISYKVRGGYSFNDDGTAEVYWNATGNAWEVPIVTAVALVRGGSGLLLEDKACYEGVQGDATACADIQTPQENETVFTAIDLPAGSGLTIAQAVDADLVEPLILERLNTVMFFLVLIPLLLISLVVFGYRYKTKYKTGNTIIAQYEPYKDFRPMYTGMLFDGKLDPRDITAGIVYLAEQGFIKVQKIERKVLFIFEVDDYSVELLRPFNEVENTYLQDVLLLLFPASAQIHDKVTLSDLKNDLKQQRENAAKLEKLRRDLKNDMHKAGFFHSYEKISTWLLAAVGLFCVLILISVLYSPTFLILLAVAVVCSIVVLIIMYERRTRAGYEAQDHLKGFKLFLSVTDTERFAFHNAPQKSPEQFMEYLPYAIAFGVEKQWAKAFEDITIPQPSWYDGGSAQSFSAVNLTSSLSAFSTSLSASSGSSASSGGGSSGGGGGGGGGSW